MSYCRPSFLPISLRRRSFPPPPRRHYQSKRGEGGQEFIAAAILDHSPSPQLDRALSFSFPIKSIDHCRRARPRSKTHPQREKENCCYEVVVVAPRTDLPKFRCPPQEESVFLEQSPFTHTDTRNERDTHIPHTRPLHSLSPKAGVL